MIIKSILDLDLYKLTVMQIAFHRFSNTNVEYKFTCRNEEEVRLGEHIDFTNLHNEIHALGSLKLTPEEREYLLSLGYFKRDFVDFLSNHQLHPLRDLTWKLSSKGLELAAKGSWLQVILYETMILSIVNELYFNARKGGFPNVATDMVSRLVNKIKPLKNMIQNGDPLQIIEFGTRRRASLFWQRKVLLSLSAHVPECLVGTSNVHLAMRYGLTPVGTFGHEFPMTLQGLYPPQHSQSEAFKVWLDEYQGLFGIALTDTFGDAKFLQDWTLGMAKAYDGVRHDSGDPFEFGEMIIKMYEGFGIDPKTKKIVFSDGLDIPMAIQIANRFRGKIMVSFGIGTNLTNDGPVPVPQIVMKVTESNGQPVAKLSANPAKACCTDPQYLAYLKHAIDNYKQ
jgi:nicotinate phosphoribosyltransferase